MALDVEVDRDVCMGSGNCVSAAPGVFELDSDSIASVVDPAGAPGERVIAAARRCPTGAISVRETGAEIASPQASRPARITGSSPGGR